MEYTFSALPKTWIIDLDGTIVRHNGYIEGEDQLLEDSLDFMKEIPESDRVIILTARKQAEEEKTIEFLHNSGIRFDDILFDIPVGERILINDCKPSGLKTAYAINKKRNDKFDIQIKIDESL